MLIRLISSRAAKRPDSSRPVVPACPSIKMRVMSASSGCLSNAAVYDVSPVKLTHNAVYCAIANFAVGREQAVDPDSSVGPHE